MEVLFMIVAGAVLGWLTAVVLQIESSRGILLNMAAGLGGALLAGLLIGPMLTDTALWTGQPRMNSLLLPLFGSAVLLVTLNLLHRTQLR